jgi:hypothetical protein
VGQTPSGLLNENSAGSGRIAGVPQFEHSQRSLKRAISWSPAGASRPRVPTIDSFPSPRRNACSQASTSRSRSFACHLNRSMTTCTSRADLGSAGTGSSATTSPPIHARVYPARRRCPACSAHDSFCASATGASTSTTPSSGHAVASRAIDCGESAVTTLPHFPQWTVPSRANRRRR